MEEQKFKEKIYGPYGEAWKIIKLLSVAEDESPNLQEILTHYIDEVGRFKERYADNEFALALYDFLLRADDKIMRMNRA